ncbi:Conserved hypothetical protein CHP02453 [Bacteroides coprosuis DSM 18011]|uniref:TIGR02453 family protein n=1 Tax=Bacteroides coprosuis DSM 18011 TaxID=679937 RepID=F3ZPC8_9BACE|nr:MULTISPECIES: DUF2461 domain-containing protein [Bacteroides]EGJ71585.1 Conserved hypothetical protein CHP02453 [Bacteroides coprosuis DSM 18011]HJD92863.1 DUF2461 domain-containing protein [Bacteroides coprosuis]
MELEKVYHFLTEVEKNNNRDWFAENKGMYEEAQSVFEDFVQLVINRIAIFDPAVMVVEPKDCTFRIYRDIRFSPNKLPYKTHMGAYINVKGRKSDYCGYYVHLQPGKSFLGGGSIGLPTKRLTRIREQIMERIDEYIDIVEDPKFKKYFPIIGMDFLKTAPKGFSKDYKYIDYLRCKEYICSYDVTDDFFLNPSCLDEIGEVFQQNKRFADFINSALGY